MKVYADHAATTKLDVDAFNAMKEYLLDEYGNASQPYSFSRSAKKAIASAKLRIAECINAEPNEIYITSCGTESDNWVIKSIALDNPGCEIITSSIEHHAILNSCSALNKLGYKTILLPVNETGLVEKYTLENAISENVKLVSIMMANNEIGTIEPIKELCSIAHRNNILFHTDAVQALGHIEIDVKDLGIDMLSGSAHKFNGPKGIGFLYVKKGVELSPYINGGSQEGNMRAGTENVASIVGMAVALEKNCLRMEETKKYLLYLENKLISRLNDYQLEYLRNGDKHHIPGNLSLSFKNANGEMILHRLDLKGIAVSTGSACDSKNAQVSHVLKAIDVPEEYAKGTIRISLGFENTSQEIDYIADAILDILRIKKTLLGLKKYKLNNS